MTASRLEALKSAVPWYFKIPAKILMSRLPVKGRQWQRMNLFRAGTMDTPSQAFEIFKQHCEGAGLADLKRCTVLELGPGNSALTALYARSLGAGHTWLIDAQPLASDDVDLFVRAEQALRELKLPVPGVSGVSSTDEALSRLNATYLTEGIASLRSVPDEDIDFFFSNAVLEHVRLNEFPLLLREMRRILKPHGVASHQIDFRDHLQQGLNNLRFSERIWESNFMARSGFYTNRITWPNMKRLFEEAGFSVALRSSRSWPNGLPTPHTSMASPFNSMHADDLMVMDAHAVLRRTA